MTRRSEQAGFDPFRIKNLLRALLAVILLVVLFQFVPLSGMRDAFLSADIRYIAAAAALLVLNIGLQIVKWRYFVRLVDPSATSLETAASLLFGITVGSLTPGQIGEFGGRALHHSSVSVATIIGLTLVDKVQMLCIMGIGGVVSLAILYTPRSFLSIFSAALASVFFLFIFFRLNSLQRVSTLFQFRFLERPAVRDFLASVSSFRLRHLVASFGLSAAFYLVIYLQMFLLLNAFSSVPAGDAFLGFASMMFLKSLIPISLGDLGIREAGSVYFFALLGIPNVTALNASLLLFTLNILIPSVLGTIFVPKPRSHA